MGGGNGQKAKMAREKNLEKMKGQKGSQLESNKKAMNIQVLLRSYQNYEIYFRKVMDHVKKGEEPRVAGGEGVAMDEVGGWGIGKLCGRRSREREKRI
ncbi:Uncharacterized protein MA16_Dca023634 [Dendrobium catenatum]|uniref:Small EDRK-rich factor-like N-terminal domain-containing protein n=1 Tax=Dendrobium catenatum TaxID=906689 RepID=A0A2I0X5V3_9ASPA|nr:Uncharacterized protein MA16_Dca023634 [Dendrobium catenatum]